MRVCSEEIFRACRLVVDTGLHALGWTRDQAVQYMLDNTALSAESVGPEVDRYITWPGQACSYKMGERKIKELRRGAEERLGERFDVKEFHRVVLTCVGPLIVLESCVERWMEQNSGQVLETCGQDLTSPLSPHCQKRSEAVRLTTTMVLISLTLLSLSL